MESSAGFEPTTPRLGIWCSIQLSYGVARSGYTPVPLFPKSKRRGPCGTAPSNILQKVEAAPWPYLPVDLLPIFVAMYITAAAVELLQGGIL